MAVAETANLLVNLNLEDNLTAPATAALNNVSTAADRTETSVRSLHSRFREFGRTGSEIAVIANAAGDAFGVAGGEAIRLAADVGLVTTAFADLGPAALRGAAGVLGLRDALDAEAIAATNARAGSLGFIAGLAGIVGVGVAAAVSLEQYSEAQDKSLAPTRAARDAAAQHQAILALYPNLSSLAGSSFGDLSDHVDESTHSLAGFGYQLTQEAGNLDSYGNDINALGGSIEGIVPKVTALGNALDDLPRDISIKIDVGLFGAGAGILSQGFTQPLTGESGDQPTLVPDGKGGYKLVGGGTGARGGNTPVPSPALPTLGSSIAQQRRDLIAAINDAKQAIATNTDPTQALDLAKRLRDAREAYINFNNQVAADAARARQQALDAAAAAAKKQQQQIAAAITDTYRTAKGLEDDYFARAHANRLKQIQDTLALAQAQHDAAVKAINDALQTQLANNAKPVTAAQAALTNTQNQEQLRNLQEAADAAFTALQQNTDPAQAQQLQRALRDAREALANFKAQLNITNLQATQNAADAKAKADAQAKIAAADAVLAAADSKAKKDTLTENQRYATIQKRFNDDLDKVLKETIKKHKSMNDALQALIQLIAHFGGTSAGIPKVKQGLEVPKEGQQIHVTVNVPAITIGARAVTNALSTQITPSQSPYVRTGQTRPKFSPGS